MISIETRESITFLQLRHGKANAMDLEFCQALADALREIDADPSRATVLSAEGSIFSAGVDLPRLLREGGSYVERFLAALESAFVALIEFSKPLVVAINGHAIAGGCVMAAAGDARIMASGNGRIGAPELLVGVPFPVPAFELMRLVVPTDAIREVLYSGKTYSPSEALSKGLIDEIVEPSALEERAHAAARDLAAIPPASFAVTKRQLRQPTFDALGRQTPLYGSTIAEIWGSPTTQDAIRRYVEQILGKKG